MFSSKRYLIIPVLLCVVTIFGFSSLRAEANESRFASLLSQLESITSLIQSIGSSLAGSSDSQLAAVSTNGLIAHYTFDEGSGSTANDSSGRRNDGDVNGASWVRGVSGNALQFDGTNDYVDLGDSNVFDLDSEHTVAAWVRPQAKQTGYIFDHGYASCCGTEYGLLIHRDNSWNPHSFKFALLGGSRLSSGNSIEINDWTHVAVTWDGQTMRIYENGQEQSSGAKSGEIDEIGRFTTIGARRKSASSVSDFFAGEIDDLRVYSRGLSAGEVQNLYREDADDDDGTTPIPDLVPSATINFSASPSRITEGSLARLTWSTSNAESCEASDGWSGAKRTSGSQVVSPSKTTTYRLKCVGNGGSETKRLTVEVETETVDDETPEPNPSDDAVDLNPRTQSGQSALEQLAESMEPGTFAELDTEGLTRDFMTAGGCSSPITSFSDNAVWDPIGRDFLFIGGPHGCQHVFAAYSEASNSWTTRQPYSSSAATHGYDHTTIDVAGRTVWFRKHANGGFHSYDLTTDTWDVNAIPTPNSSAQVSGGLDLFPNFAGSGQGRLVHINYTGGGEVEVFENGGWNEYADVDYGDRAAFIEYNPVHDVMLFGGGWIAPNTFSQNVYAMDSDGNVSQKSNAPQGLGITESIVTSDPVSGKYLVFVNESFYEYDVTNDAWSQVNMSVPFLETHYDSDEVFATVAAPLSTHGVVMFLQYLGSGMGGPKVWLYKHAEGSGTPPPLPRPSVNLVTNPASITEGSSAILNWTALNATECTASDGWSGLKGTFGTETVTPTVTTDYILTCTGAGGDTAVTKTVTVQGSVPDPIPTGDSDFETRCSQPGVVRCVDFDEPEDLAGRWGNNSGITFSNDHTPPQIDTTVRASGDGSLKMTIPSNSRAGSAGSYFTNFSDDLSVQFDSGDTFYVQWRQKFDYDFLFEPDGSRRKFEGGGGWKQAIIGTGDQPGCTPGTSSQGQCFSSCSALETVVQNTYHRGFPQMYNSCSGSAYHGPYDPFQERYESSDFKFQNARPEPFCLLSNYNDDPDSTCFKYHADEWMTFQVEIQLGERDNVGKAWVDSNVRMWVAREGQSSELVMDWGPYALNSGNPEQNQQFGKVWLLPYNTDRRESVTYPETYTWYDDLIVSTALIPDPTGDIPPQGPAFDINDRVEVNTPGSVLNIRVSANGVLLGTQPDGAQGTVSSGPVTAGDFLWWNINFDTGVDGWAAQDFLTEVQDDPDPDPVDPPVTGNSIIDNITTDSGRNYETDWLQDDADVYVDRSYEWRSLPDIYSGAEYILTANNDKQSSGNSFLTFELDQPATVLVAYDIRQSDAPAWLNDWNEVSDVLVTTDTNRNLYAKEFASGSVALGGNEGASSMYSVIVIADESDDLGNADLSFMRNCFLQTAVGDCASADFNGDDAVNFIDLAELKSAERFDLSGDLVVDLNDRGSDIEIIEDCYAAALIADCRAADFDDDGDVDVDDLEIFQGATKYDLNDDDIVDLRDDTLAFASTQSLSGAETNESVRSTSQTQPIITTLSVGETSSAVVNLQNMLIAGGYLAADDNTGYYGLRTMAAVQRFQRENNIVSSGDADTTGYGVVGPQTARMLNQRFAQ